MGRKRSTEQTILEETFIILPATNHRREPIPHRYELCMVQRVRSVGSYETTRRTVKVMSPYSYLTMQKAEKRVLECIAKDKQRDEVGRVLLNCEYTIHKASVWGPDGMYEVRRDMTSSVVAKVDNTRVARRVLTAGSLAHCDKRMGLLQESVNGSK